MQDIVKEDLRHRACQFGIWSQIEDEVNDDFHLVIHRTEEGNWVTLQAYLYNRSIHLIYPRHEGAPPHQTQLYKTLTSQTHEHNSVVGHRQKKSKLTDKLSKKNR